MKQIYHRYPGRNKNGWICHRLAWWIWQHRMKAPASKGPRHSLCQSWTAKGVKKDQNPRIHDSQKKSPNFTNFSVFLRIFLWQFGCIFAGGTRYLDWNWSQLEWIPEKHWKHSPLEVVRSDWSVLSRPPRRNFGQRFQADEPNAFVTRLRCLYKHFLRKETQSVVFLRSENGANISTE